MSLVKCILGEKNKTTVFCKTVDYYLQTGQMATEQRLSDQVLDQENSESSFCTCLFPHNLTVLFPGICRPYFLGCYQCWMVQEAVWAQMGAAGASVLMRPGGAGRGLGPVWLPEQRCSYTGLQGGTLLREPVFLSHWFFFSRANKNKNTWFLFSFLLFSHWYEVW